MNPFKVVLTPSLGQCDLISDTHTHTHTHFRGFCTTLSSGLVPAFAHPSPVACCFPFNSLFCPCAPRAAVHTFTRSPAVSARTVVRLQCCFRYPPISPFRSLQSLACTMYIYPDSTTSLRATAAVGDIELSPPSTPSVFSNLICLSTMISHARTSSSLQRGHHFRNDTSTASNKL
jgi:hypothetical protein